MTARDDTGGNLFGDHRADAVLAAVEPHLAQFIGPAPNVFHEILSDGVHLDLVPYAPTQERDFWVVATLGMSAKEMTTPQDVPDAATWSRAELLVTLPGDWPGLDPAKGVVGGEAHFHPLAALKKVARYPHLAGTSVAVSHTINLDAAIAPDSEMTAILLWWPLFLQDEQATVVVADGVQVNYFQLIPIHADECAYAQSQGGVALFRRLAEARIDHTFDLKRPSVMNEAT